MTAKYIFFKFIAMLLYPLMPVYVLAKHSWYESKLRMKRRHLQTDEYGLPEGEYHANSDDEKRKEKIRERIDLYKQVLILEANSLKYGKFYSYFRVTSAMLESTTQVTSKITSTFHNKLSGGGVHSPPIGLRPGWSVCQSLCGRRASSPHSLCHLQRQFAKHLCDPLEHVRHHLCPCEVLVPGQEFGSNSSGSGKLSFPNHTLNPRPKNRTKFFAVQNVGFVMIPVITAKPSGANRGQKRQGHVRQPQVPAFPHSLSITFYHLLSILFSTARQPRSRSCSPNTTRTPLLLA